MERQSEAAMAKWRAQLDQRTKELEALQVGACAGIIREPAVHRAVCEWGARGGPPSSGCASERRAGWMDGWMALGG